MLRKIIGFHKDEHDDWVADLDCFHSQHTRNTPPFINRPWVEAQATRNEKLGTELNCVRCDNLEFPDGLIALRRTHEFTQDTIPAGLKKDHNTKVGVWGVINVVDGELTYQVNEPETKAFALTPDIPGIIPPRMLHSVEAKGTVRFYVEFFSRP